MEKSKKLIDRWLEEDTPFVILSQPDDPKPEPPEPPEPIKKEKE